MAKRKAHPDSWAGGRAASKRKTPRHDIATQVKRLGADSLLPPHKPTKQARLEEDKGLTPPMRTLEDDIDNLLYNHLTAMNGTERAAICRPLMALIRMRLGTERKVGKHPALAAPYGAASTFFDSVVDSARIGAQRAATPGACVVLVGDIVSGFEAWGPFESGTDAVRWKQEKGVREFTQGQWFLLPLKEAK